MSEALQAEDPMPLPDFLYAAMDCEERGEHGLLQAPTYSSTFSAKAMRHIAWALRVAEIVREPTDDQANSIGFEALEADGDRTFQLEGRAACHRILELANEAGERDE